MQGANASVLALGQPGRAYVEVAILGDLGVLSEAHNTELSILHQQQISIHGSSTKKRLQVQLLANVQPSMSPFIPPLSLTWMTGAAMSLISLMFT